jgi:glycine betaine/proline transport system substrate-binding protein
MKYFQRNILITLIVISVALFATVGISAAQTKPITFGDFTWDSVQFHNRVAGFLIENGWERDVNYMVVQEIPGFVGMERGDLQLAMEAWVDNSSYWDADRDEDKMVSLGKNYPDAPQGWYVPTYMIEGDEERGIEPMAPDLKSVKDLPRYWELFKNRDVNEKGKFYNGPSGWVISTINKKRLHEYGLEETFQNVYTGSAAALATAIAEAYEKGEAVLAYYWEPTPILGMYDMTKLEEPPYDPEVWKESRACAIPNCRVYKIANTTFLKENPTIKAMLERYKTTLALTNEALAYMKENNTGPEEAARWFLKEHPDLWKSWVKDPDRQERISKALKNS